MTEPATPKIVTRDEWEWACAELLIREKGAHACRRRTGRRAPARLPPATSRRRGPDGPVPLHDVYVGEDVDRISSLNKGAPPRSSARAARTVRQR